jgi:hypothetical protein
MSGWSPTSNRLQPPPRTGNGARSGGPRLGPFRITPMRVVVAIAFLGSLAYIGYAVLRVRDTS